MSGRVSPHFHFASADWTKLAKGSRLFLWKRLDYYRFTAFVSWAIEHYSHLEKVGGRFEKAFHHLDSPGSLRSKAILAA